MSEGLKEPKIDPEILEMCRGNRERALQVQSVRNEYKHKWWESNNIFDRALGQLSEPTLIIHENDFAGALEATLGRRFDSVGIQRYAGDKTLREEVEAKRLEIFEKKK